MTAYGTGSAHEDGVRAEAEVKSFNHRGLDVSVRLPDGLGALEARVCDMVKSSVSRGKVLLNIAVPGAVLAGGSIDIETARRRVGEMQKLKETLRLEGGIGLAELLMTPGLFAGSARLEEEKVWPAIRTAVARSLKSLIAAREAEGEKLAEDLRERHRAIAGMIEEIDGQRGAVVARYREKLRARVAELLPDAPADAGRLEREVVLFAEKCDVGEEVARMRSHLHQLDQAMAAGGQGRKIEFIAQEMLREAGTIAVKANDSEICRVAVETKAEIARVREQAANIE